MITRKAGAALAAGCTVIVKPSPETPLSACALAQLALEAGFPAGVFTVLPVEKRNVDEVGEEVCLNEKIRKISFTGSTGVGKLLLGRAAGVVKKASMELGGNAPFIVFEDCDDLGYAARELVNCKFRGAGQTCISVNRCYIHESIYDAFTEIVCNLVKQLKVGHSLDVENPPNIGALISKEAVLKVQAHIQDAIANGATVLFDGRVNGVRDETLKAGNFLHPVVLGDVGREARVNREETFGPLLCIFKFKTEDEVVDLANDSEVGLAGYFFTANISRVFRVAEKLEVGMVGVNEGVLSADSSCFGGVKQSGYGREGGKFGIDEYLTYKYVSIGGLQI